MCISNKTILTAVLVFPILLLSTAPGPPADPEPVSSLTAGRLRCE